MKLYVNLLNTLLDSGNDETGPVIYDEILPALFVNRNYICLVSDRLKILIQVV